MGDYQRLQTEAENESSGAVGGRRTGGGTSLGGGGLTHGDVYYSESSGLTSRLHAAAFATSVAACIIVVVVFLWALPCHMDLCTTEPPDALNMFTWNKTLQGLELKGQLHFVGGNLIGIFRNALWGRPLERPGRQPQSQRRLGDSGGGGGGVIALVGRTGDVAWYTSLAITPTYLDCSLLDFDSSGSKGCLVLGENGFLEAFNSESGIMSWKLHSPNASLWPVPQDIDLPVSVPDLDRDRVADLATLSRFSGRPGKHRLALISAGTGVILSEPLLDQDCLNVYNLTYDVATATLHYTCTLQNGSYSVLGYSPEGLPKPRDKTAAWKNEEAAAAGRKWKGSVVPDRGGGGKDDDIGGEYQLKVVNTGTCATHCWVSVTVTDPEGRLVWNLTDNAYAMSPVPLNFKKSIKGFLLKLWKWHSSGSPKSGDIKIELIQERIILITFTKSGSMHLVNASQTDITQLCNSSQCQPQLSFQTQSALIVDLNGDGSHDLVSYYVSYSRMNRGGTSSHRSDTNDWVLETSVRVVRLEAELPKLYDAISKH